MVRIVVAGALLLVAAAAGAVLYVSTADDDPVPELSVGWGGGEGHPACIYDPEEKSVAATLVVDGEAPDQKTVTVTVTAYADENTSQPVGSGSRRVKVDGDVHTTVVVTMDVERAPHVDEDGVAACRLEVDY